jgi:hypothetical protein
MISTVHRVRISKMRVTPDRRGVSSRRKTGSERRFLQLLGNTFPAKWSMLAASIPDDFLQPSASR